MTSLNALTGEARDIGDFEEPQTLRDFYAMAAMKILLKEMSKNLTMDFVSQIGEMSYRVADRMMLARKHDWS